MSVPIEVYGLKVPAGGEKVPVYADDSIAAPRIAVAITMAAVDAAALSDDAVVTLKLHRVLPPDEDEDEDEEADADGDRHDAGADEEEDFVICNFVKGKLFQQPLNFTVRFGEEVYLSASGKADVFVTGNYAVAPDVDYDSEDEDEDEDEYDSEDDSEAELLEGGYSDEDDDHGGSRGPHITELDDDDFGKSTGKRNLDPTEDSDDDEMGDDADESDTEPKAIPKKTDGPSPNDKPLSKRQLKKLNKKLKKEDGSAGPAPERSNDDEKRVKFNKNPEEPQPASTAAAAAGKKDIKKTTLPNGVVIEDYEIGNGPGAKPGQKVGMRYIGKLTTGKQFDANTKGAPFVFTLGRGEVIKGWDEGIKGMKVGGKRKLTVPAPLAYGKKAQPGIPSNSTLIFECKLVSLK